MTRRTCLAWLGAALAALAARNRLPAPPVPALGATVFVPRFSSDDEAWRQFQRDVSRRVITMLMTPP